MATELCDTCRAFDIQAFDPVKYKVRGYKLLSAIIAAESGCPFCSVLVKARFPQGRKRGAIATLLYWSQWIYLQADEEWRHRPESQFYQINNNTSSPGSPLGLTRLWAISVSSSFVLYPKVVPLSPFQTLADEGASTTCPYLEADVVGS